jgi:hypothetical protein
MSLIITFGNKHAKVQFVILATECLENNLLKCSRIKQRREVVSFKFSETI